LQIEGIVEFSVSANQAKFAMRILKWRIEGDQDSQRILRGGLFRKDGPNIDINAPMEIRTVLKCIQEHVTLDWKVMYFGVHHGRACNNICKESCFRMYSL
jgi:hypothetical protein